MQVFKWIKKFYLLDLYSDIELEVFVRSGDITQEQKHEIIGYK